AVAIAARSIEGSLVSKDLSPVRCLVSDLAHEADLSACRVVLLNGQVIADSNPSRISPHDLPDPWPTKATVPTDEPASDPQIVRTNATLNVPGKGRALLQVEAPISYPMWSHWQVQLGAGVIAVCGMGALLASYRRIRIQHRAM